MNKIEIIRLTLSSSVIGGLIVAFANFVFSKKLKIREAKLRQLDKILNKQFDAYENVLNYFESLKLMIEVSKTEVDNFKEFDDSRLLVYPYFFKNKETYDKVSLAYRELRAENGKWLDSKLKIKLFEFESYFFYLDTVIKTLNTQDYWNLGVIVRNDIQGYIYEVFELCYTFYNTTIFSTKVKFDNKDIDTDYDDKLKKALSEKDLFKYMEREYNKKVR